ncbi:putative isocitrate dehydrogenase [Tanacetum coccineum]
MRELGLPTWTRTMWGVGFVIVKGLECYGGSTRYESDRFGSYEVWREMLMKINSVTNGKHPPKVINVIASMVLASYSFGVLAGLALVVVLPSAKDIVEFKPQLKIEPFAYPKGKGYFLQLVVEKKIANPVALLLSSAMMLRYLQLPDYGDRLETAMKRVI